MSNTAKHISYRYAWERIRAAVDAGFPLEAVTIAESIIADRLLSYLQGVSPSPTRDIHTPLAALIRGWRERAGRALLSPKGVDLGEETDEWRRQRNRVLHGIAKSPPGTATPSVDDFRRLATETAVRGARLARAVSHWHRKQLAGKRP